MNIRVIACAAFLAVAGTVAIVCDPARAQAVPVAERLERAVAMFTPLEIATLGRAAQVSFDCEEMVRQGVRLSPGQRSSCAAAAAYVESVRKSVQ